MSIPSIAAVHSASDIAAATARTAPSLVPVGDARWRVLMGGRIIGHLDELSDAGGARYRASRYRRATGSLVSVGDFSRSADAIDALRYAG